MPIVHTSYVAYARAGGRRLHAGGAAHEVDAQPSRTNVPSGGSYGAWASRETSWSDAQGEHGGTFAFWSIVGAADGSSVSTSQQLDLTVGESDVQATAWYLPVGGAERNGKRGLYIDAFDVDAGRFFDEDFVTVASSPSLSAAANETGFVPTTAAVELDAVEQIELVPFLDWTEFVAPAAQVVDDEQLHADAGANCVALAFYRTPDGVRWHPPRRYANGTWVSYGVKVDAGGATGNGPQPPWTGPLRVLAAGLALGDAVALVSPELRADVSRLAARQVLLAAEQIGAQIVAEHK